MLPTPITKHEAAAHPVGRGFRLCYRASHGGLSLSFPCDITGRVHIHALDARDTANYLLARTLVGRDFDVAIVLPVDAVPAPVPPVAARRVGVDPITMERGAATLDVSDTLF